MDKIFETALFNRKALIHYLDSMSHEQLIAIPENFNNSMIWNIGHILVTQQLLTYKLSGLPLKINTELVEKYAKGSKATQNVSKAEVLDIKNNLISAVLQTQEDYNKGVFKNYEPYLTSLDISLDSIDDALKFNAFHDGIHLGILMSLKKVVG